MAIDPNIVGQLQTAVPPPVNPIDTMAKIQTIRDNQQKLQAMQDERDAQARANQTIASMPRNQDGTYDAGKLAQLLAAQNVPLAHQEQFLKAIDGVNGVITSWNKAKTNHISDLANSILTSHDDKDPVTPEAVRLGLATAVQAGIANQDEADQVNAALAKGGDPKQVLTAIRSAGDKYNKPDTFDATAQGTIYSKTTGDIKTQGTPKITNEAELASDAATLGTPTESKTAAQSAKALAMLQGGKTKDEYQTFKDAYAKQILGANGTWDGLTPDQQLKGNSAFTISKQDPTMQALLEGNAELRGAMLKAQRDQLPTKEDAANFAKALINHQLAPSQINLMSGFGPNAAEFKKMIGLEALKLDPNFSWEQAESDYQFGKSAGLQGMVRFIDETTQSIPRLLASADQLANSKVRFVNGLQNLSREQLNDPTLKKFQVDALAVADGVAKALQGGGTGSGTTDAKLAQAQQIIRESDSPQAVKASMQEVNELLGIRRGALTRGTYLENKGPAGGSSTTKMLKFGTNEPFQVTKQPDGTWKSASGGVYDDAGKRIR
jgi:hypothetical protein